MANQSYLSTSDIQTIYAADLDYTGLTTATISGMLSAASRQVDSFTNASKGWDLETVTEVYDSDVSCHTDADGNLVIPLIKRPLTDRSTVSNISITLGTYNTSLTLSSGGTIIFHTPDPGWDIIYPNIYLISIGTLLGNIKLSALRSYRYFISLTYQGGYQTIPEDIRYATSLYFRNIYAKKYNPAAAFDERQGSMSVSHSARGLRDVSPFVIEAQQVLQTYIRVY